MPASFFAPFPLTWDGAERSGCPKLLEEITDEFKMNVRWAEQRELRGDYAYGSREEVWAVLEIQVVTTDVLPAHTARL